MSTLNTTIGRPGTRQLSASLRDLLSWYLLQFCALFERMGQRRAAPELARAGKRIAATHPELAAELAAKARRWQAR